MPMKYYEVVLADSMSADAFEDSMTKLSSTIDRQPTRVGAVEGDTLFRSLGEGPARYIWGVDWSGIGPDFVNQRVSAVVKTLAHEGVDFVELVAAKE
jgi:hypothetical protein